MTQVEMSQLGPLLPLVGHWEGIKGEDKAPDDDKKSVETNLYREKMRFEYIGQVDNHEQSLFGLRYHTMAWRLGVEDSFHEDTGYLLWDTKAGQVLKCFVVPRGISVIAGGKCEPGAKTIQIAAAVGSDTYGICSNQFLDREFKTVRYELKIQFLGENSFSYESDSVLKLKGQEKLFHHTDRNTLKRAE